MKLSLWLTQYFNSWLRQDIGCKNDPLDSSLLMADVSERYLRSCTGTIRPGSSPGSELSLGFEDTLIQSSWFGGYRYTGGYSDVSAAKSNYFMVLQCAQLGCNRLTVLTWLLLLAGNRAQDKIIILQPWSESMLHKCIKKLKPSQNTRFYNHSLASICPYQIPGLMGR